MAVVVFVALNPVKRLQDSRNARRTTDVTSILSAVHSSIVDNQGAVPAGITSTKLQLGTGLANPALVAPCAAVVVGAALDLSGQTLLGKYLKTIPVDPQGTATATGYAIEVDSSNLVTVTACLAEGTTIEASR